MERLASAIDRVPPQNLEAEQSTLGSMMLPTKDSQGRDYYEAAFKGIGLLDATDFYRPNHQEIFEAVKFLVLRNEPVDLITLQEELRKRGKLEDCGSTEYLMALVDSVPTASNIEHYARIVADKILLRRLIAAGTQLVGEAQMEDSEPQVILNRHMQRTLAINANRGIGTLKASGIALQTWKMLEDYEAGKIEPGVMFSIPRLNEVIDGVRSGQLLVIAAESGGGKTVLLSDLIDNAGRNGIPCLVFSYEMDASELFFRMICGKAGADSVEVKRGSIDWEAMKRAHEPIFNYPVEVCELPCTIGEIYAIAHRWALENVRDGRGIIIVDYLQKVIPDNPGFSREEKVSAIAGALKNLGRRLHVGIATASQFSKKKPGEARRSNNDLRESGAIEHEADKVLLVHPIGDTTAEDKQYVWLEVTKHRNGRTGRAPAVFNKTLTRFFSCEERDIPIPTEAQTKGRLGNWWSGSDDQEDPWTQE